MEPQDNQRLPAILIRPEVMRDLQVSANEYMVLETVFMLSALHGYCYKGLSSMSRDLALRKSTCQSIIERLLKRGLLNRSAAGLTVDQEYIKAAHLEETPDPSTKIVRKVRKSYDEGTKIVQKVRKSYERTKTVSKNNNKNSKEHIYRGLVITMKGIEPALKAYIDHRKSRPRASFTQHALDLAQRQLQKLYPDDPARQTACIEQTVLRGWSGLFPLKDDAEVSQTSDRVKDALRRYNGELA